MPTQPLPSRDTFLSTIETIEHCDICQDTFSASHTPVRTPCNHIFGSTCLSIWAKSSAAQANACPKCRQPLFKKPSRTPTFAAGADPYDRSSIWLESVTGPRCAGSFVRCLWYYLSGLLTKPTIYDTDLEEAVDNALGDMGRNAKMGRPCIRIEHMTAVREVARDMVKEQYTMEGWRELEEEEKVEWVRKLGEVLGWRLRAGRG